MSRFFGRQNLHYGLMHRKTYRYVRHVVGSALVMSIFLSGCAMVPAENEEQPAKDVKTVETITARTASGNASSIPAWHEDAKKAIGQILGDEVSKYGIYAFYPTADTVPLIIQSRPMRSASMIKVFIMGKAMQEVERGRLSLDEMITLKANDKVGGAGIIAGWADGTDIPVRELLRLMITESDNTATNLMIDRLGMEAINEYIRQEGYGETKLQRKMMDTAAAEAGRENITSPADLGHFFTRLWKGEGMTAGTREQMLTWLYEQTDTECLPQAFPQGKIAHKTGELVGLYDDGGIVVREGTPLVICIMNDDIDSRGGAIRDMQKIARVIGANGSSKK